MKDWHPKSWAALLMGSIVLVFVLDSFIFRIIHPDPAFVVKETAEFWKELMLAIIGGLMVWIGSEPKDKP